MMNDDNGDDDDNDDNHDARVLVGRSVGETSRAVGARVDRERGQRGVAGRERGDGKADRSAAHEHHSEDVLLAVEMGPCF
jgi:hypothetical protein